MGKGDQNNAVKSVSVIRAIYGNPLRGSFIIDAVRKEEIDMNERSELHCHTKMSKMAGITDVKELIRTAKKMGMPAIAITDNETVQAFPEAYNEWKNLQHENENGIKVLYGVEIGIVDDIDAIVINSKDQSIVDAHRVIMIAASQEGIRNMYKLISVANKGYSKQSPVIPRSALAQYRDGLIIGSCAQKGDVIKAAFACQREEDIRKLIRFYDFVEVEPVDNYLYESGHYSSMDRISAEDVKEGIKQVIKLGKEISVPVIASANVHYVKKGDKDAFRVLGYAAGFKWKAKHHLMSTEEMLVEFAFLGEEAEEIVIDNPNKIIEKIDAIQPVNRIKKYPEYPKANEVLKELCMKRAHEIYGEALPGEVKNRMQLELEGIQKNGFASLYMIAYEVVRNSNEAGFPVEGRGSSGASFVSFLLGISETNPIPAHYRCEKCGYVEFYAYGVDGFHMGDVGMDLPNKVCPDCGGILLKDGYDIPVETFLGVNFDKEPDFDLNFPGEYKHKAMAGLADIEGIGEIYHVGTTETVSERQAKNYAKQYYKAGKIKKSIEEISKVAEKLVGVRASDGLHPGGIIAVPEGTDIFSYTPVVPERSDGISKTQIDYYHFDGSLLKLDLLQHDTPAFLKFLSDETGIDPTTISMNDNKVMSLFSGIEALGIKSDLIGGVDVGTLGVPEFGHSSVRKKLELIRPGRFSDVIRISGAMHDTWDCDPFEFIKDKGLSISEFIGTRDDIMLYLIDKGIDREKAFEIMEWVRKGKGRHGLKEEWIEELSEKGVPDWYMELLTKILYLFPKAHCAGYVLMSWRLLYYKLYYPKTFYKGWLKYGAREIDEDYIKRGYDLIREEFEILSGKNPNKMGHRQKNRLEDILVVMEMYARGVHME